MWCLSRSVVVSRLRANYGTEISKRSFTSTVRPAVCTNPPRENALQTGVFLVTTEVILKTELLENNDVTTVT